MDQELKLHLDERDQALHDLVRLVGRGVLGVNDRIQFLRAETTHELAKLRSAIGSSDNDLSTRMDRLEERLERQARDVLEEIRKISNSYLA